MILDNCETKKCSIVFHNSIVALTNRKKNFWPCLFVFCFLHFGNLEEQTTLKKTKQKSAVFFSKGKCSLFCFWQQANFASNKMSRVLPFKSKLCKERSCFSFSFCKLKSQHLLFEQEVFRKVLFVFWTKYIWHKSFRKKRLVFFPLAKTEDFVV